MEKDLFRRKIVVRVMTITLTFFMFFGGVVVSFSGDYTGDINKAKNELSETKKQLDDLQKSIQDIKSALNGMRLEQAAKDSERLSQMSDRELTIEELELLKQEIENFDVELENMEKAHDELVNQLLDRSRVTYQSSNNFDVLQMFFESSGLFDFMRKLDAHRKMVDDDEELIATVLESERQIEEKRAQQVQLFADKEQLLAEIEQAIIELKSDSDYISGNYETLSNMLSTLEEEEADYSVEVNALTAKLNNLEKLQREAEEAARKAEEERKRKEEEARKAAENEKKRLEEEARKAAEAAEKARKEAEAAARAKEQAQQEAEEALKPKKNPKDWNFCWPIESYTMFTGKFGYRVHPITHAWQLHAGVDLASKSGTKIYAAQAGTVSMARDNGPYGLCVIIDHGDGLQSVYGHCSKLLVSEGQKVTRGQNIALVGMTGGATGPHLHFEVRENGTPVDPLPYVEGLY